jgi:hypothetical protein
VAGCCEHGKETSGSIKDREFIDFVSGFELIKKDFPPWS